MNLADRLGTLEDNLTPKELMILSVGEAHQHDNLVTYVTWLLDQPEDEHPLTKLPEHLYQAAVSQGRLDDASRRMLRARYRDLLFLYHLHVQINERVLNRRQELLWRALWAVERQRTLLREHRAMEPSKSKEGRRAGQRHEREAFKWSLEMWRREVTRLSDDLGALLGAAQLLSDRYFSCEELIFPDELETLSQVVEMVDCLRTTDLLTFVTPAERKGLFAPLKGDGAEEQDGEEIAYPPSPAARALARELVALARGEALVALGDVERGADVVEEWLRQDLARSA